MLINDRKSILDTRPEGYTVCMTGGFKKKGVTNMDECF